MSRNTLGPRLIAAIEQRDLQHVIRILAGKLTGQPKATSSLLVTEVRRIDNSPLLDVPLLAAARSDCPQIIKYLVDTFKCNINHVHEYYVQGSSHRKTPLLQAVCLGKHATAAVILSLGADPAYLDHNGRSALHHAVRHADLRMARLLLAHGARPSVPDEKGNTPLHVAVRFGHAEMVTLLVKNGADLYVRDKEGASVIHIAAKSGHASLVRYLVVTLKVEPDLRVKCYDGRAKSPIHVAAQEGHYETVHTLLLWCSANVQVTDSAGDTALHYAVSQPVDTLGVGTVDDKTVAETAKVLLGFSISVRSRNNQGETALHLAAKNGLTKAIELMLAAGCDTRIKDENGKLPIDRAAQDDSETRRLLMTASAAAREKASTEDFSQTLFGSTSSRRLLSSLATTNTSSAKSPSKSRSVSGASAGSVGGLAHVLQRIQRNVDKSMSCSTCNTNTNLSPTPSLCAPSHPSQSQSPSHPNKKVTVIASRSYIASNSSRLKVESTNEPISSRNAPPKKQPNIVQPRSQLAIRRELTMDRIKLSPRVSAARSIPQSILNDKSDTPVGTAVGSQPSSPKSTNRAVTAAASPVLKMTSQTPGYCWQKPLSKKQPTSKSQLSKTSLVTLTPVNHDLVPRKAFSQTKIRTTFSSSSDDSSQTDFNSSILLSNNSVSRDNKDWGALFSMLNSIPRPGNSLSTLTLNLNQRGDTQLTPNRKQTTSVGGCHGNVATPLPRNEVTGKNCAMNSTSAKNSMNLSAVVDKLWAVRSKALVSEATSRESMVTPRAVASCRQAGPSTRPTSGSQECKLASVSVSGQKSRTILAPSRPDSHVTLLPTLSSNHPSPRSGAPSRPSLSGMVAISQRSMSDMSSSCACPTNSGHIRFLRDKANVTKPAFPPTSSAIKLLVNVASESSTAVSKSSSRKRFPEDRNNSTTTSSSSKRLQ